jgi:hypothetical protein
MAMKKIVALITSGLVVGTLTPARAQTPLRRDSSQSAALALEDRYQIGLMEGILQRAAEHGAKLTRDLARTVVPGDMLLSDEVRVRGIRLPEYGVFFYIDMPDLEETTPWIIRTLDQNDLGRDSALRAIRALVESSGNANDRQALQRIEMQLAPSGLMSSLSPGAATLAVGQSLTGAAASTSVDRTQAVPMDPILSNPQGVYRAQVSEALIEAILDHSSGLRLDPKDWFTVAARGKEGASRLSPADTESPTIQISVRGEDLIGLLARQISREEARKRVLIKVF